MAPVTTETDVHLPAPPSDVFAVLLDAGRFAEWQPLHDGWPDGVPAIVPGATFVQRTSYGGRSADVRWTVDRLDEPRTVSLTGTGPMGLRLGAAYRLDEAAGGTRLTATSAAEGGPVSGPLKRVARKRAQGVAEDSLERLRAVVAGREPTPVVDERPHAIRLAEQVWSALPKPPVPTGLLRRVPGLRRVV